MRPDRGQRVGTIAGHGRCYTARRASYSRQSRPTRLTPGARRSLRMRFNAEEKTMLWLDVRNPHVEINCAAVRALRRFGITPGVMQGLTPVVCGGSLEGASSNHSAVGFRASKNSLKQYPTPYSVSILNFLRSRLTWLSMVRSSGPPGYSAAT
jgi:hypothetical protein